MPTVDLKAVLSNPEAVLRSTQKEAPSVPPKSAWLDSKASRLRHVKTKMIRGLCVQHDAASTRAWEMHRELHEVPGGALTEVPDANPEAFNPAALLVLIALSSWALTLVIRRSCLPVALKGDDHERGTEADNTHVPLQLLYKRHIACEARSSHANIRPNVPGLPLTHPDWWTVQVPQPLSGIQQNALLSAE